jgi:hypothetical protein
MLLAAGSDATADTGPPQRAYSYALAPYQESPEPSVSLRSLHATVDVYPTCVKVDAAYVLVGGDEDSVGFEVGFPERSQGAGRSLPKTPEIYLPPAEDYFGEELGPPESFRTVSARKSSLRT